MKLCKQISEDKDSTPTYPPSIKCCTEKKRCIDLVGLFHSCVCMVKGLVASCTKIFAIFSLINVNIL